VLKKHARAAVIEAQHQACRGLRYTAHNHHEPVPEAGSRRSRRRRRNAHQQGARHRQRQAHPTSCCPGNQPNRAQTGHS
jgi:hypothetical protein